MTGFNGEIEKPLAELLVNVEVELRELRHLLQQTQNLLSPLFHLAGLPVGLSKQVQALDLAAQRLEGLGLIVAGLASAAAPSWIVSPRRVVAEVKLQALADRICGATPVTADDNQGGCELF